MLKSNIHPYHLRKVLFVIGVAAVLTACVKEDDLDPVPPGQGIDDISDVNINDLEIPAGFTFETSRAVNVTVADEATEVRYNLYLDNADISDLANVDPQQLGGLLASGAPASGQLIQNLSVPTSVDYLILERATLTGSEFHRLAIANGSVAYEQ